MSGTSHVGAPGVYEGKDQVTYSRAELDQARRDHAYSPVHAGREGTHHGHKGGQGGVAHHAAHDHGPHTSHTAPHTHLQPREERQLHRPSDYVHGHAGTEKNGHHGRAHASDFEHGSRTGEFHSHRFTDAELSQKDPTAPVSLLSAYAFIFR